MIKHILKDGTEVKSIRGVVISQAQFPQVYRVIEQIEERSDTDGVLQTSDTGS